MSNFKEFLKISSLPMDAKFEERESSLIVTKWNWSFKDCEKFQQESQLFIQKNRNLKIFIFTNHPHCYTLGRGNERGDSSLLEFDSQLEGSLGYPLYRIHRGGGITFHFPGQWIFYPIQAIRESFSLEDITCWLLKSIKTVLVEDFNATDVITANKLMGVWRNKKKLASIGIGVSRFVTIHGIALNLCYDEKMFNDLSKINPCGMSATTYECVDQILGKEHEQLLETFHRHYLRRLEF